MATVYVTSSGRLYCALAPRAPEDSEMQSAGDWLKVAVQLYPDYTEAELASHVDALAAGTHPEQIKSKYSEGPKHHSRPQEFVHPARKEAEKARLLNLELQAVRKLPIKRHKAND